MPRYFVGVAWPYANGPFHMGHLAGAYLPGDAFARFHRLKGDEVLMVSGSDMHGTPILVRAEQEGTTPEAVARRFDAVNRESFERLGFTFDRFTDTHTLVHEKTVQELFLRLLERGFVGRRTEQNPYCPKHQRFLPDRYLIGVCPHCGYDRARGDECENCGRALETAQLGAPRCSLCGTPAEFRPSEHFYLLLDRLAPELRRYVEEHPHWRPSVAKVAKNFLAEGLHPTPITRDLDWGIPIPLEGYDAKRFYVWFDALIGYVSASKEWAIRAGRPEAWKRYWDPKERTHHYYFIGKDNTFHHTILWPGILLGAGDLPLPHEVAANEWLVLGGKKLAKSGTPELDATIPTLLDQYPPDHIRFYAALLAPQNHDTEFDLEEFRRLYDEILANQFGNLAQRLLVLTRDRLGGIVPTPPDDPAVDGPAGIGGRIRSAHERITAEFEQAHLKEALEAALAEVREENRRFHEAKPWEASEEDLRRAVYEGLWVLAAESIWLSPFLPFSTGELHRMLGGEGTPSAGDWDRVLVPPEPGRRLGEIRPLFPRKDREVGRPVRPSGKAAEATPTAEAEVPLEIRAARIAEVRVHPSADRLYVMTIDVGEPAPRTVVAGLRGSFAPEQLHGRRVALLANLEPRKIRSVESQGMVLAAESEGRVGLLLPPESAAPGTPIEGLSGSSRTIRHDAFESVDLRVGRVSGSSAEGATRIDLGERTVEAGGSWEAGTLVVVRLDPGDRGRAVVLSFGPTAPLSADPTVAPGAKVR
ncbi:MAG TPA: methionine--tRNA ligase [Thermoplasmata archaeon]|nr:methionine--tRNA ligase [Thermoplasmata archaeon]